MAQNKSYVPWTLEQDEYLTEHYGRMAIKDIAAATGHTAEAVATRAKNLGICNHRTPWTEDDDKKLRTLVDIADAKKFSLRKIAELMGRPGNKKLIAQKVKELGLQMPKPHNAPVELTEAQLQYIRDHYGKGEMSHYQIAKNLGISAPMVCRRAKAMGLKAPSDKWTEEEKTTLENLWGYSSPKYIAKRLGRSVTAVYKQAEKLRLGSCTQGGEMVFLATLIHTINGCMVQNLGQVKKKWFKNGLPTHQLRTSKRANLMVDLQEFWPWAKEHRNILDFADFEPFALGEEPDWVMEKRLQDQNTQNILAAKNMPWTEHDDATLLRLIGKGYTVSEIAEELHRTASGVTHRCVKLDLKLRPVRKDSISWAEDELDELASLIRELDTWAQIGAWSGRGELSCINKARYTYGTSDIRKLRAIIGLRGWDHECKSTPIKNQKRKSGVKAQISRLCEVINTVIERNEAPKRLQCQVCEHWDLIKGCAMGETDGENCTGFLRMAPRYCTTCGALIPAPRRKAIYCETCEKEQKTPPVPEIRKITGKPKRKRSKHTWDQKLFESVIRESLSAADHPYKKVADALGSSEIYVRQMAAKIYGTGKFSNIKAILEGKKKPPKPAAVNE